MLLRIRVIPNSNKVEIEELGKNCLRVKVQAPPISGRANSELIAILARYYNKPKQSVKIERGLHSRNKIVEVKD